MHDMTHDMSFHMYSMWGALAAVIFIVIMAAVFFSRTAKAGSLLISDLAAGRAMSLLPTAAAVPNDSNAAISPIHDTIFILPDISNYTRFMTGNRFAFGHAQHVVFSLINSMVKAVENTAELSKLEGDAALFFVDADRHDSATIGQSVTDIFIAFFSERDRLIKANICPCSACATIADLDLKIFVHRGRASRFSFRGSIDHFGTDVIILHRMMKNGVSEKRYVMITDAAADSIKLPIECRVHRVEEELEHVGKITASVHSIDNETAEQWASEHRRPKVSRLPETLKKLTENIRSLRPRFGG